MRWLSAGVYLGIAFVIWLKGEEEKSKNTTWNRIPSSPGTEAYEPSDEFIKIYNHYNNKENTNA